MAGNVLRCCLNFRCKCVLDESLENRNLHQTILVNTIDDPHWCGSKESYKKFTCFGRGSLELPTVLCVYERKSGLAELGPLEALRKEEINFLICTYYYRVLGMPKAKGLMSRYFNWQNSR